MFSKKSELLLYHSKLPGPWWRASAPPPQGLGALATYNQTWYGQEAAGGGGVESELVRLAPGASQLLPPCHCGLWPQMQSAWTLLMSCV